MSGPFGSSQWMYASGDYEIDNSLRMNGNADLDRTPDASNRRTFTLSAWVKRVGLSLSSTKVSLLDVYVDTNNFTRIGIESDDKFSILSRVGNQNKLLLQTGALLRDTSAWYHFVCAVDTTDGTANDRAKIYINGVEVTVASRTNPDQNYEGHINAAVLHDIGKSTDMSMDAYIAEYNFIDGLALDASYFGETDDTYGHWKPKEYGGAYGNEGFYLDFKSSGVGTAGSTTVGADRSGNGNHYTSSNIATTDQVLDSPTNNFCTLNTSNSSYNNFTAAEGNLKGTGTSSSAAGNSYGTQSHQKGYFEWLVVSDNENSRVGIKDADAIVNTEYSGAGNAHTSGGACYILEADDGTIRKREGGANAIIATYTALSVDDIGMCAFDIPNQKIWFGRNGTWFNSGDPANGNGSVYASIDASLTFIPVFNGDTSGDAILNFGQDSTFSGEDTSGAAATDGNGFGDFYYTPPSGFLTLCSKNLPEPSVVPSDLFNCVLWTGNATDDRNITGVGFQPDFTWIKSRGTTNDNLLFDSVRGAGKYMRSNSSDSETSNADTLQAFASDGFQIGADSRLNTNDDPVVSWNWKAGTSVSGNTTGAGTAKTYSGSVNTGAGFSIIKYTGNGTANHTIPHNLGGVPEFFMIGSLEDGENWAAYHKDSHADPETRMVYIDLGNAPADVDSFINDVAPTSSVTNLGDYSRVNENDETFIMYSWRSIYGYSKIGTYMGDGNASGPYVYLGFRPAYIMVRNISRGSMTWYIQDNRMGNFENLGSTANQFMQANSEAAQDSPTGVHFHSNGFKVYTTGTGQNLNGETFIYMAYAEIPFKYSNAK